MAVVPISLQKTCSVQEPINGQFRLKGKDSERRTATGLASGLGSINR